MDTPPTDQFFIHELKETYVFIIMILSIDCGIKNLAMCLIDPNTKRIEKWDVSGVPPKHDAGLFPCLVRHLNDKSWIMKASTVLIEKQPDKNRSMKSVEKIGRAHV